MTGQDIGTPSDDATGSGGGGSGVVVLGRAGVRTAYVLLLASLAAVWAGVELRSVQVVACAAASAGATAWLLLVRGADEVRLEADALVVRSGRRRTRYAWDDVLEVSWRQRGSLVVGPGLVARIRGGPFDEPGPNLPAEIASPPIFGRRARAAAEHALRTAVLARGIRFDPHMERDIALGRRRPQDPERHPGA